MARFSCYFIISSCDYNSSWNPCWKLEEIDKSDDIPLREGNFLLKADENSI